MRGRIGQPGPRKARAGLVPRCASGVRAGREPMTILKTNRSVCSIKVRRLEYERGEIDR